LPKAKDFQTGTNAILMHSRVFVFWIAAGVAMGVYDRTIKYASERKQFGKSISGII
jgi:alkylation response protein AidB-like acyl-CoA dehydrogenase